MNQKQSNYNLNKYKQIDLASLLHTYNTDRDYTIMITKQDNKNKDAIRHDVVKPYVGHVNDEIMSPASFMSELRENKEGGECTGRAGTLTRRALA